MKKAVFLTASAEKASLVFCDSIKNKLFEAYSFPDTILNKGNLAYHLKEANEAEYIFSTWGMEHFSKDEIEKYFPKAECLFYAAGSVQHFAEEFLSCGIRVFSAWKANAIPVAEFTHAQIILALKGFFTASLNSKQKYEEMQRFSSSCGGVYKAKVGLIGIGSIGALVAEKLMENDVEVFFYDPFLKKEEAQRLNITPMSLEEIFSKCNVISNHLANKEELNGIINGSLFNSMMPYSVFINTGRGNQVNESDLISAMKNDETKTALLDVLTCEPLLPNSEIVSCNNIIITPHIAGSLGNEVVRMAEYMSDEAKRIDENKPPLYEVTESMLSTMA